MVSFSGIKVLPNINQKYPIHCSVFIHLRPECLFPYSWKGAFPLFTFFASIYSSIFPSFASLPLLGLPRGIGETFNEEDQVFLNFIFFVLLFSVLFVVFFFPLAFTNWPLCSWVLCRKIPWGQPPCYICNERCTLCLTFWGMLYLLFPSILLIYL